MITFYGSPYSPRVHKVLYCFAVTNLPFQYVKVDLGKGAHKKPDYLQVNPFGKVPTIDDDGFKLFESNVIMKYLAKKAKSPIYPDDLQQQAIVDQWCDFVAQHIEMNFGKVAYNRIFAPRHGTASPAAEEAPMKYLNEYLPVLDATLAKHPFLAGNEISIADFSLLCSIDFCDKISFDLTPYPHLIAWHQRCRQQPFYAAYQTHLRDCEK